MPDWRCVHCGDTGVLHVYEYDPLARMETREYDSPCHACPAGAVMTALVDLCADGGER